MRRRQPARFAALIAATLTALVVALGVWPGGLLTSPAQAGTRSAAALDHQLASLRLFNRVVLLIRDHYVDQERIHPREMMLSSLDWVEKRIAEVLVDEREALETGKIKVTVGAATRTFDISEVDSLWDMSFRLKDIFAFIEENLVSTEDTREIEYAAINGMLATLDPHSNLLTPEQYADMKMHTRGEFGGLGFVVSVRKGRLTVMKVLKDTPASRGGVEPRDVITQIEDESTVNMDVTEAVKRLRGKPGTAVGFWVEREGWDKARKFTLDRAIVSIDALDPVKLLADNVAYARILSFQGNTTRELKSALERLQQQAGGQLNGLIIDLRNNPGGLLDQAVQVADLFVDDGTIVSTVSAGHEIRERNNASRSGDWDELPLVVLVNQRSASASEIVSGAMKNLDRGVIIGTQTFGKGSVQVLYDLFDESALKLTIAEYLTAGDLSIQELGVAPDIELVPAVVSKEYVRAFAPYESMGERELAEHMQAEVLGAAPGAEPAPRFGDRRPEGPAPEAQLRFLSDVTPEHPEDVDDLDEFVEPEWKEDFHVRFARELLAKAGAATRSGTLAKAKKVIDDRATAEEGRIHAAIRDLGLDWNGEGKAAPEQLQVTASLEALSPPKAGATSELRLTVTNQGNTALDRVRAWTESKASLHVPYSRILDKIEFVFGHLEPGQSKQWTVPVEFPENVPPRTEPLAIQVEAKDGAKAEPVDASLTIEGLPKPRFAFAWYLDDSAQGNADGMLSPGEAARLIVPVRNMGKGEALEAVASVKNLEDGLLYISKGRHEIGELAPGALGQAPMILDLKAGFDKSEAKVRVALFDAKLGEVTSDDVALPVAATPASPTARTGAVRLTKAVDVVAYAGKGAPALAHAKAGAVLPTTHQVGGFYRVSLPDGLTGFVPVDAAADGGKARQPKGEITLALGHRPPVVTLASGATTVVTDQPTLELSGEARHPRKLRDLYVFLNDQKVYFKAAKGESEALPFQTRIPLDEGLNTVVVFARENDELVGRETLMVYRKPAEVAQAASGESGEKPATQAR